MATRGPAPRVSDKELVNAVAGFDKPYATAKMVAERVGLSSQRTRERLRRLVGEGEIESGQVGDRYTVYWSEESLRSGLS